MTSVAAGTLAVTPLPGPIEDRCSQCQAAPLTHTEVETYCSSCGLVTDASPLVVQSGQPTHPRIWIDGPQRGGRRYGTVPHSLEWANMVHVRVRSEDGLRGHTAVRTEAKRMADRLSVHGVDIERVVRLVDRMSGHAHGPYRAVRFLVAASFVVLSREMGVPLTLHEIADAADLDRFRFGVPARSLIRVSGIAVPNVSPLAYLRRFMAADGWMVTSRATAERFLADYMERAPKRHLSRTPQSIAAGVMTYTVQKLRLGRTDLAIANATGLTEVTGRSAFFDVRSVLGPV